MRRWLVASIVAVAGLAGFANVAHAQGALVNGSVAAAVADGTTSPAFGGGVSWRLNRALGFGVELTHIRTSGADFPRIYCCGDGSDSNLTSFTTNVRLEIPTTSSRVIPFVIGGGGVAAVTRSYSVIYATLADQLGLAGLGLTTLPILPGPPNIENTTTSMALTLGGGASVLVSKHFAVDVDLRVLHVMGDEKQNIGRFGGGLSYRF